MCNPAPVPPPFHPRPPDPVATQLYLPTFYAAERVSSKRQRLEREHHHAQLKAQRTLSGDSDTLVTPPPQSPFRQCAVPPSPSHPAPSALASTPTHHHHHHHHQHQHHHPPTLSHAATPLSPSSREQARLSGAVWQLSCATVLAPVHVVGAAHARACPTHRLAWLPLLARLLLRRRAAPPAAPLAAPVPRRRWHLSWHLSGRRRRLTPSCAADPPPRPRRRPPRAMLPPHRAPRTAAPAHSPQPHLPRCRCGCRHGLRCRFTNRGRGGDCRQRSRAVHRAALGQSQRPC
jgi:hypothetical protein